MINSTSPESWGGDDDWEFKFEPEARKQKPQHLEEVYEQDIGSGLRNRRNDPLPSPPSPYSDGGFFMSQVSESDSQTSSPRASKSGPQLLHVSQVRDDLLYSVMKPYNLPHRTSFSNTTHLASSLPGSRSGTFLCAWWRSR